MEQHANHPLRDNPAPASRKCSQEPVTSVDGTRVANPIDGSQYIDVVEEQAYADQRPTAEEQKPRFSYLQHHEQEENEDKQEE